MNNRVLIKGIIAYFAGIVVSTGNNAGFDPVAPGSILVSAVASESTAATAGHQILSRQVGLHFAIRVNANTVRHGFDSSKSLRNISQITLN